jgi:hypothetical protein
MAEWMGTRAVVNTSVPMLVIEMLENITANVTIHNVIVLFRWLALKRALGPSWSASVREVRKCSEPSKRSSPTSRDRARAKSNVRDRREPTEPDGCEPKLPRNDRPDKAQYQKIETISGEDQSQQNNQDSGQPSQTVRIDMLRDVDGNNTTRTPRRPAAFSKSHGGF